MFCPACGVEYREGFVRCADCGVPLVDKKPKPVEDPDLDLVTVLETRDRVLVSAAKSLLDGEHIPCCVLGDETGKRYAMTDGVFPWFRIQVGADHEAEARSLLREFAISNQDPTLELVTVLETDNSLLISASKSLLEENEIPYCVLGDELGRYNGPADPFVLPWVNIQVGADREAEARSLLGQLESGLQGEREGSEQPG